MTDDLHAFISDVLHRRQLTDRDSFALRSAEVLSKLMDWDEQRVANALAGVKTNVYRCDPAWSREQVLQLLARRIIRRWPSKPFGVAESEFMVVKVLFVTANPVGIVAVDPTNNAPLTHMPLGLDHEHRAIKKKIRASEHRDRLRLESCPAARPSDLVQSFNEERPTIVHFSGHGSKGHELILLDEHGEARPVSTPAIESLFKVMKDEIRVVVLNACFSKTQAAAITKHIDCAIGMTKEIGDDAAIIFGAAFYAAIGFGRSVQEAFDQAVLELRLAGIPKDKTPKLMVRKGVNAANVRLIAR